MKLRGLLCLVLIAVGMSALNVAAAFEKHTTASSASAAVSVGARLERSGQWLDAIEEYEKGLKAWPQDPDLKYGLRRAKVHFDIQRRCSDPTYGKTLQSLSRYEALALFDEVLDQVKNRYVDNVSGTSFIAHGTESLYYALGNPKFLERNIPRADESSVWRLRETLRTKYWNKPVPQYGQASDAVAEVCDLAQQSVGLPVNVGIMEYVFGGCNALDDYSAYLTPGRLADLYDNIDGQFVGLGVEIKSVDGEGIMLVNVLPESPASEGGLGAGDRIVSVNGVDCRRMSTDQAADLLRGPAGSRVHLEVMSSNQVKQTSLLRKKVTVHSIPIATIIDRERGIGYIRMTGFQKATVYELDHALYDLRQQGMRALIWDVRGNPGGLLDCAVEVADRFIDRGVLVSTRGRGDDSTFVAHSPGTWNMPLVLLIDGNSASASEIVAGAIRDHHRGALVGRKTYGKWSVQEIIRLRFESGLRLTTARFYSPNGDTLGKIGVEPDYKVEAPEDGELPQSALGKDFDPSSDGDIQKALDVLRSPQSPQ